MAEPAGFLNSGHQLIFIQSCISSTPFMIEYTLEIEVIPKVFA